jgi:hypothetical protein
VVRGEEQAVGLPKMARRVVPHLLHSAQLRSTLLRVRFLAAAAVAAVGTAAAMQVGVEAVRAKCRDLVVLHIAARRTDHPERQRPAAKAARTMIPAETAAILEALALRVRTGILQSLLGAHLARRFGELISSRGSVPAIFAGQYGMALPRTRSHFLMCSTQHETSNIRAALL